MTAPFQIVRRALAAAALAVCGGLASQSAAAQEAAAPEEECVILFSASNLVSERINAMGFDPEDYDALCARLQAEGAGVFIESETGTLGDQVIAWSSLRLLRTDSQITSILSATNTRLFVPETRGETDDEIEGLLQMASINVALEVLHGEFDAHLEALEAEEARLAAFFAREGASTSPAQ